MLEVKNAGNIKANPNCIGENVSSPLAWPNAPDGTRSFARIKAIRCRHANTPANTRTEFSAARCRYF